MVVKLTDFLLRRKVRKVKIVYLLGLKNSVTDAL